MDNCNGTVLGEGATGAGNCTAREAVDTTCTQVMTGGVCAESTCGASNTMDYGACADIDDCVGDPCGQGTCSDTGANSYECACHSGYTFAGGTCIDRCAGDNCETNVVVDVGTILTLSAGTVSGTTTSQDAVRSPSPFAASSSVGAVDIKVIAFGGAG